ncbi:MAG: flagellar hook assembly protein FlgD [Alphaproteobacteria bacterium]|nr:flagellar hook assembly protein FlgD [Alphaproteobacteria bacterium]
MSTVANPTATPAALGSAAAASSGSSATASNSKSASAGVKLSGDINTFLKLLVTQLKNQDPLNPTDSNQFTQQLAQYSQVEQTIQSNSNLEKLIGQQEKNAVSSAVNYIGKSVTTNDNKLILKDGIARFTYSISDSPASASIRISDSKGNVVRQINANTTNDTYDLIWDGKDNAGTALPNGLYTLTVSTTDAKGTNKNLSTTVFNPVNGIKTVNNQPVLLAEDKEITMDKVLSVTL